MLRSAIYGDMGDERPSGRLTGRDRPQTDGGDDRSIKESCPPPRECAKTLNGDLNSGTGLKGVPADRETAPKGEFCALEDRNSALSAAPSSPPFTPIINATHVAQMSDLRRIWRSVVERRFQANFWSGVGTETTTTAIRSRGAQPVSYHHAGERPRRTPVQRPGFASFLPELEVHDTFGRVRSISLRPILHRERSSIRILRP